MSRGMAKRSGRAQIPTVIRLREQLRRTVAAVLTELTSPGATRRATSARAAASNAWRTCPVCFHRHPHLCPECGRGALTPEAPRHTEACCPGLCRRCRRCLSVCPGPCLAQGCTQCLDLCPGHDEEAQR